MSEKPMMLLTFVLFGFIIAYFWLFGFSPNKWTRYGQYGGLAMCIYVVIDQIFTPA